MCHYCEGFRVAIVRAVAETEKARLTQDFKEHSEEAQMEHKYYLDCIERAKWNEDTQQYTHYMFDLPNNCLSGTMQDR